MIRDILNTNFNEVILVLERGFISLTTLFLVTKLIGKKQVSELSLFDYVVSISIGNFAAEMTTNLETQFLNGFFGVVLFGILAAFISYLTLKSIILRRFFTGTPTLLMENGNFIYKNLKRTKIDINDFLQLARISGYFDISQIKFAIMEANGKISFMPKEDYAPVINKDLNLKIKKQGLCSNVIIDGKVMKKNLLKINKDEKWLLKCLKLKGYDSLEDILLVTADIDLNLKIFDKKKSNDILNVLE